MEKRVILNLILSFGVLAVALVLLGCSQSNTEAPHQDMLTPATSEAAPSQSIPISVPPPPAQESSSPASEKTKSISSPSDVKEFTLIARQFEYIPGTITVHQGDHVKLLITSEDVTHGFILTAFHINEQLPPGKTVEVNFVADKKGIFDFFCSIPCGSGHGGMRGKLVVE